MPNFLDLSAEIRNKIYGLALDDNKKKPRNRYITKYPTSDRQHPHIEIEEPALLHTSVQVRNEALPMFHAITPFKVGDHHELALCLRALGTEIAAMLREIRVGIFLSGPEWQSEARSMVTALAAATSIRKLMSQRDLEIDGAKIYVALEEKDRKRWWCDGDEKVVRRGGVLVEYI